jgi:hypothetical protein
MDFIWNLLSTPSFWAGFGCGLLLAALVAGLTESYVLEHKSEPKDSADEALDRIKTLERKKWD